MIRTTRYFLAGCYCLASCSAPGEVPEEHIASEVTQGLSPGTLTSMNLLSAMGDHPGNLALLTDGSVFASGNYDSASWYRLFPNPDGFNGYSNGSWLQAATANLGRVANPSFILRDGRYWEAGGEYVSDNAAGDRNQGEVFDPNSNQWTRVSNDHFMMSDAPATLLADGNTIIAGPGREDQSVWLYDASADNWTLSSVRPPSGQNNEGGSLLLPDGRVFAGSYSFSLYQPNNNTWVPAAATATTDAFEVKGEIGPFLLLQNGNVLVLGGNSHNGIYSPASDSWLTGLNGVPGMVADTPGGLGHADTTAVVEPNGRVLAVSSIDTEGQGTDRTLVEYSPDEDIWISVPTPSALGRSGDIRMLAVPAPGNTNGVGQIMITGGGRKAWFYTPSVVRLPDNAWRPSISNVWVAFGDFHVSGTQLNGLTTGADEGDDGRMATNYPVAWVDNVADSSHTAFFARSFDFDQMAPRPSTFGEASFDMPLLSPQLGQLNGTWNVHVAANGLEASNTVTLTITDDRGWGFIPLLQL